MRGARGVVALTLLLACTHAPRPDQPLRQVVLVTLDTLRADHLGCYGSDVAQTPNLDALAAESLRFDACYSTTNVTLPSHASIFTSLHLKDHGVKDNFTRFPYGTANLVSELRGHGLHAAAFVGSGAFEPRICGFDPLFDEFFPSPGRERAADAVNADVLPWLERNRERSFFAWIHYFDAHAPYAAPPLFAERFAHLEPPLGAYHAEVAYLDAQLGRLFHRLETTGIAERAVLVVVADHGESLGEHGITASHRGVHEATTRVPLLVRVPGLPPRVSTELASTLDVYPTIFAALDLPTPPGLRGHSLLEPRPVEHVFAESAKGAQLAVRTREHRAILTVKDTELAPGRLVPAGRFEVFASSLDPAEAENLAGADAELARTLRELLEAFPADGRGLEPATIRDTAHTERLEALGYVR